MLIWEHRTVLIGRGLGGSATVGDWQVDFGDGDVIVGLQAVLDYYGSRGWELVALQPQSWSTTAGQFGPWDVARYQAIFKRAGPGSTR